MASSLNAKSTASQAATVFSSSIAGKHVLVTGSTIGGLGFEAARAIAHHKPALLVITGRSLDKLQSSKAKIVGEVPEANIRLLVVDFNDLSSVRKGAMEVLSYSEPIDVLINNIAIVQPFAVGPDGHDLVFTTNQLSPFLFTNLLKPKLLDSPSPRVVIVSSAAHLASGPLNLDIYGKPIEEGYHKWAAYGQTKTANLLWTTELAKRWKGIPVLSLHPGMIPTNWVTPSAADDLAAMGLGDAIGPNGELGVTEHWKTIPEGAATHIVAAFDPALKDHSGSYLVDCQIANDQFADHAKGEADAAKLWTVCEGFVGQSF